MTFTNEIMEHEQGDKDIQRTCDVTCLGQQPTRAPATCANNLSNNLTMLQASSI